MKQIFVDTSGWGNFVVSTQQFHAEAKEFYLTANHTNERWVTTNYVLVELVALLTSPLRLPRVGIIEFIESIKDSAIVEIIHIDENLDTKSWQLFANRHDKNWSLVDCSSFVIMQERNISEALTTDHHFEQAGFVRLLKDK